MFVRSLLLPSAWRSALAHGRAVMVGLLAVVALAIATAPAGAVVTTVASTKFGLQPRDANTVVDGLIKENEVDAWSEFPEPESFANAAGNPVLHGTGVYAIYWDPSDYYHGDWQNVIDTFLHGLGAESGTLADVFAVDAQYTDKSNQPAYDRTTFRGAYTDTEPYLTTGHCTDPRPLEEDKAHKIKPLACLTDAQIRQELQSFISAHGLPTGMGSVFYLLTPPGVTVCLNEASTRCSDFAETKAEETAQDLQELYTSTSYKESFCSYHSDINPDNAANGDASTVLYGVIPWIAGGRADGQLTPADETEASYCQDGGFDPSTKPKIEKREEPEPLTAEEEAEYEKKKKQEKEEFLEARELLYPHDQEPNQTPCPSSDGYCDTGLADLIINQIAVEQQNTVTDPLLDGWQDAAGDEATDECRNFFATVLGGSDTAILGSGAGSLYNQLLDEHQYYLNTAFNLAALRLNYPGIPCLPGVRLEPKFTAPTTVNSGEIVGFDGMESDFSLVSAVRFSSGGAPENNFATYTWNFGDESSTSGYAPGAPACTAPWLPTCAASVFHSYQYGGTYPVTLTVTDVAGNSASVTHEVTVVGPGRPSTGGTNTPGQSQGTGSSSTSTTSTTTSSTTSTSKSEAAPLATAAILSRTFRSVVRKGVDVRYSVSEQVTGHFEVLLAASVARKLGLRGSLASGLPKGTPPQMVIGKALLVTARSGHSTLVIKLVKKTSAQLHRLHKTALMLRLVVRNAAAGTATVLSSAMLTP